MGFNFKKIANTVGRVALGTTTGGLSEVYRALAPSGGGQSYAPLPFENPSNPVDQARIASEFQKTLGRAPTQSEIEQYAKYITTGDLQYGDISNILQSLPEQQKKRLESDTTAFGNELNQQNQGILDQAAATANSRFAGLGRANTSAMGASVLRTGGELAQARQSALANFYGNGLQNINNSYVAQGQGALNRGFSLADERARYNRELAQYQAQRNDYGVDLANQQAALNKRQLWQIGGSLVGAGIGAYAGQPVLGARLGSQAVKGYQQVGEQPGGLFGGYA